MIGRLRCLAVLLLLAHGHSLAASPADMNRQITMNRAVNEVALSPDGKSVAAVITDPTSAGGLPHLWLLSSKGSPAQITGLSGNTIEESSPAWTADGRSILYLGKSANGVAVQRQELGTGRIETLSLVRQGADIAGGWETKLPGKAIVAKGFAQAQSCVLAVWGGDPSDAAEKAKSKEDQYLFDQSAKVRLYLLDHRGTPREVPLPDDIRSVTWDKEGRRLLVITQPASDDLGATNRLWLIEQDKAPREVLGTTENVQAVSWLADDRIAYIARCSRNAPIVCRDLFVQALDGSAPRNLTDDIDGSLMSGSERPIITRSGDVLVPVARRFEQQVARIRLSDGRISWVDTVPAVVKSIATNDHQTAFALLAAERGGVVSVQLANSRLSVYKLMATPELQTAEWKPLQSRRLGWGNDDHRVDGLLYLPEHAAKNTPVPLVLNVHGGPAGRFEDVDYPLVRLMLNEGWAVLQVNPTGSLGYGVDFLAAVQDDLGGVDYRDIMTGVDAALTQAPIDKEKLAMIGYSYGGTMTTFALGRTDRFKAFAAVAPVIDQLSEYGTEHSSWYDRWYFGQPWKRLEAAWRQSPLAGAANAQGPLLLFHGDGDIVNPLGQSLELYRALRQEGSPVELTIFPREGHYDLGKNFYGNPSIEPHHGIALRQRLLDFLRDAFAGRPHAGLVVPQRASTWPGPQ